jgi:D-inositol-3-phosphate glycosyltransferase
VHPHLSDFGGALDRFVQAEGVSYDLISSHYWLSGLVGLQLRRKWNVPHVTSFHTRAEIKRRAHPGETDVPERDPGERRIVAEADRIVVWSEHERDSLTGIYGAAPERIVVIPPGVDSEKFRPLDPIDCRERLGVNGTCRILYVGRLERLKGVDILLRAVASFEDMDCAELTVVGGAENSPERERLRDLADALGIADRVEFIGSVDQSLLPVYYGAADICVLPSYYESFGLAALEAAACGRPVVASRVGGLPSIVRDGETGYLVRWRCPGPFVERLELLLTNEHLRREMGAAARLHAETLSWRAASERLLETYEALTAEPSPGNPEVLLRAPAAPCLA